MPKRSVHLHPWYLHINQNICSTMSPLLWYHETANTFLGEWDWKRKSHKMKKGGRVSALEICVQLPLLHMPPPRVALRLSAVSVGQPRAVWPEQGQICPLVHGEIASYRVTMPACIVSSSKAVILSTASQRPPLPPRSARELGAGDPPAAACV